MRELKKEDRIWRPEGVLQVTPKANEKSGALVMKARVAGSDDNIRIRFKVYGGGNTKEGEGGSGVRPWAPSVVSAHCGCGQGLGLTS